MKAIDNVEERSKIEYTTFPPGIDE